MTLFGCSILGHSGALTLSVEQGRFGTLPCVRHFFSGMPGSVPSGLTTSQVWIVSFKCKGTDYTGMAAGTYDAALVTWLRSLPAGQEVVACYYHEPEDNCVPEAASGFTFAGWKAAEGHWNNLVHTTTGIVANVQTAMILMESTPLGWNGRNINNYWDNTWDANHKPDLIGFDFDGPIVNVNGSSYPDMSSWVTKSQTFAASKGIPWFVGELAGDPLTSDTDHSGRAAWYTRSAQQMAGGGATYVTYWDDGGGYLSTTVEINAWAALVQATPPPTTPAAPTGVTATPASDGQSVAIGWATIPAGVNHLDAYLQDSTQTYPHKINTAPIPVTPRSYSAPTTPGTNYPSPGGAFLVASADSAGTNRSGFSAGAPFSAPNPGPGGNDPIINLVSVAPDATDPTLFHLAASATGFGTSLTYLWTFTLPVDPSQPPVTLPGSAGDVTLPKTGQWTRKLTVTDNLGRFTDAIGSVAVNNTTGTTPHLGLRSLQHDEDLRQMAFIDQDSKLKIDAWATNVDSRRSPGNGKYGLVGSNFSPDQIAPGTTIAAASGVLMWWAFTLEAEILSQLLFATSVAQNGTGAQVGVHDVTGALLPDFIGAPASGADIDAGFATAAGYGIVVPLDIILRRGINWGDTVFAQAFWPSGMTTYPTFLCNTANGSAARVGLGASKPLWAKLTGQSAYAVDLSTKWGSWSAVNQAFVGAQ